MPTKRQSASYIPLSLAKRCICLILSNAHYVKYGLQEQISCSYKTGTVTTILQFICRPPRSTHFSKLHSSESRSTYARSCIRNQEADSSTDHNFSTCSWYQYSGGSSDTFYHVKPISTASAQPATSKSGYFKQSAEVVLSDIHSVNC